MGSKFGAKTITSFLQFIAGLLALGVAYIQYAKQGDKANPLFWSIFFLFTSALLIDKMGLIASNISLEQDEKRFRDLIERQPGLFAGTRDIVTFQNDAEGSKYLVAISPLAVGIKNTVLRYYDDQHTLEDGSLNYSEWLKFKYESVTQHKCTWTEIVSTSQSTGLKDFSNDKAQEIRRSRFYVWKLLDEAKHPMLQMTILQMSNGSKEIVWGWQFPGITHGTCFLSRNEELVAYFEKYFDHFYQIAAAPSIKASSGLSQTVPDRKPLYPPARLLIKWLLKLTSAAKVALSAMLSRHG